MVPRRPWQGAAAARLSLSLSPQLLTARITSALDSAIIYEKCALHNKILSRSETPPLSLASQPAQRARRCNGGAAAESPHPVVSGGGESGCF